MTKTPQWWSLNSTGTERPNAQKQPCLRWRGGRSSGVGSWRMRLTWVSKVSPLLCVCVYVCVGACSVHVNECVQCVYMHVMYVCVCAGELCVGEHMCVCVFLLQKNTSQKYSMRPFMQPPLFPFHCTLAWQNTSQSA